MPCISPENDYERFFIYIYQRFITGTYLYWLDFSAVSSSQAQISETLKKSGIALSGGDFFFGGRESTFFRLNFATTHERVGEALDKIERAFCF